MQHQNRDQFLAEVERIVADACGNPVPEASGALFRQRFDGMLDHFLLESQPITGVKATILLADIRGFTAMTERLPTRIVIDLLNRYFSEMGRVIKRHRGVIDKFMGDSVMALFGAPERQPDDLLRALACAVEMQQAMARINQESATRGEPSLFVGIAVNTGEVMAGSFGSRQHSEYTVIGDTVNTVARMEAFSLRGQILLSESSHTGAREHIEVGAINAVQVKGKSDPVIMYELRSVKYPQRLVVPRVEVRRSPRIRVDFPLVLNRMVDKRILLEPLAGRALDLGYNGFLIELDHCLGCGDEVAADLAPLLHGAPVGRIYARVIRVERCADRFQISLQFTNLDTPAHLQVKQFVDKTLWGR